MLHITVEGGIVVVISSIYLTFVSSRSIGFLLINYMILSSYHPEFAAVSVSGINDDEFLSGRPYGGCAILYRSSLSSSITPLHSISNRFCALKVKDQSGLSILLVCVYMPSSDIADYQDTLGALEGFIESYQCHINVIVGDFNVDFSRQSAFTHHLSTLMTSLDLIACDLHSNTISL